MDERTEFFPGDVQIVDADMVRRMDDADRRRAARMANVMSRYLVTKRDTEIETELKLLIGNASVSVSGYQSERRCLAVIGETGAGKSRSILRAIAARPEFQPRTTEMTETAPIILIKAPRPSNLKLVAYEILEKLGYPLERELKAPAAWAMVRRQLKARKVRFIHIDEAQHMLNMSDYESMQQLSDALKMVMEQDDWPVSLILTGMPELADFLSIYGQIARRSHKVHLENLVLPRDTALVRWVLTTIVEKHAEMTFAFECDDVFLARLHHASSRQFGVLIQLVRGAIERALIDDVDAEAIEFKHFVRSYEAFSGCKPDQNIFSARDWESIQPLHALLRDDELARVRLLESLEAKASASHGRRGRGRRKASR